jgi:hypothetical protein
MALFWAKSAGPNQRARPLRVAGQAQQPFGDDVELHLRRATADGGGTAGQQNSPHLPGSSFGPIAASVPNEDRSSGLEVRLSTYRGEKMAVRIDRRRGSGCAVGSAVSGAHLLDTRSHRRADDTVADQQRDGLTAIIRRPRRCTLTRLVSFRGWRRNRPNFREMQ